MHRVNTEAFVVKSRNHGEADKIYTLFTKKLGKIKALAKGVRKISSRRSGSLDALNRISAGLVESSNMLLVTEVQILDSYPRLKQNLEALSLGYSILELIDKFLPEAEELKVVYDLLEEALASIVLYKEGGKRVVYLLFEVKLLMLLGYDPILDFCASCYKDYNEEWVETRFNSRSGGLICENCREGGEVIANETLDFMRLLRKIDFKDMPRLEVEKMVLLEADNVLHKFVEHHLEMPIRSRKVFSSSPIK